MIAPGKKLSEKLAFARESEKLEKEIMGTVNGERCGACAVAVGSTSREKAGVLCRELTELLKKHPKGRFSCDFDGEKVRFDLGGDPRFASEALNALAEGGLFGE